MRHTITTVAAAAVVAAPLALLGTSAHAQSGEAQVSVLHGVPGPTVDVYANGDELIPDFAPGTLTDPLALPAGTYDIAIFADGEGPDGEPVIAAPGVEVPAGANATIVAHLDEGGTPTASVFVNDTSQLEPGQARVTARHTAAAPAVDVRADGAPVYAGLTNPNEDSTDVTAGTVSADVVLAGTEDQTRHGEATLVENDGQVDVIVSLDDVPPAGSGDFLEVWLLAEDPVTDGMVSLGVLDGVSGTFTVPTGLDVGDFPLVDVSVEPFDGDPTHSGASLARGSLDTGD